MSHDLRTNGYNTDTVTAAFAKHIDYANIKGFQAISTLVTELHELVKDVFADFSDIERDPNISRLHRYE